MINGEELLKKIKNNNDITCEDLCVPQNRIRCSTTIECGCKTFYTDGVNFYDVHGNLASYKNRKKYDLW